MAPYSENWLDNVSWQILEALQKDARVSFKDLGERIGLTGGSVAERVRKMEEMGVIKGYRAEVDFAKLGLSVTAFIKLGFASEEQQQGGRAFIAGRPEVIIVHQVLGGEAVLLRAVFPSIQALEEFIQQLRQHGTVDISIVTSSHVQVHGHNQLPEQEQA
jgi:Lrp/AsnC family transcriptional regulator, leucine-responsive regulatory protein